MKKYVLGIDIGGTNTTFGIVSEEGTIECRFRLLSKDYASFEELIKAIQKVLDSNAPKLFDKLVGVGIGAPMIHPITGIIDQAANLQWQQPIAVKAITESIFKLPVATNNDANIAMIGEWKLGKAKGCTNVVMVTLGTGVGGGFIVNNQLVLGHTGMAGEIGHMIYEPFGRSCNCGRLGCYERYVSASGIVTSYQAIKHLYTTSILHYWEVDKIPIDAKKIYEAALLKDALALEIYRYTGEVLGLLLSNIVCNLSPEKIILFGGVLYAGEVILQPTLKYYNDYTLSVFKDTVAIEISNIGSEEMGILGAAALLLD